MPDTAPAPSRTLPQLLHDLVHLQAQRRLRILGLISVCGFALGTVLTLAIPVLIGAGEPVNLALLLLCIGMVSASLVVALAAQRLHEQAALWLGHGYIITAALAMSITEVMTIPADHEDPSGVSGICIWIILFPMVLASRPPATLLTAMTCAALLPLCYLFAPAEYQGTFTAGHLVEWFVPGFFCAGLAYLASRSITALTDGLEQARQELRELSGYQLTDKLATGGMGEVWLGRHRLLPQVAAIKFIRTDHKAGPDSSLTSRFREEARAAASLTSTNAVRIYDFGSSDDGQLFLVMEYVPGVSLDSLVASSGPLPLDRCLHVVIQICRALEEMHAANILHRDIKPDNILLCRLGGQADVVKVIDLGLAIEVGHNSDAEGTICGTVGYLAPELLLGNDQPTIASDIYGLGCVAWYLLTGSEVFPEGDDQDRILAHVSDPLPDPPPHLPAELLRLLRRCLAKHPSERPRSCRAIRGGLTALLQDHPWDEDHWDLWWSHTGDELTAAQQAAPATPRLLSHSRWQ